ncbi:MAG TPA: GDSL-type esterase/lipase family protein, partial [Amnibacterium sp.]|nr:GDSL-type esterase/lipase family protein [Amnibacterium sp.]
MRSAPRLRVLAAASALLAAVGLAGCSGPSAPAPSRSADAPSAGAAARSAGPTPTGTTAQGAGTRPTVLAALGDSLSRGFDACDHYGDCPSSSWITGTNTTVNSIAARLRATSGAPVAVHNDARSGVSVGDLPRQVDLAIAQQPDLVTVLIGGNDVCRAKVGDMTSAQTFSDVVDAQLTRLAAALPGARILVASVPDVTDLRPVASADPTARFLWTTLGGCTTVLGDPRSDSPATQSRLATVRGRIDSYNASLATTCATLRRCVWDGGA